MDEVEILQQEDSEQEMDEDEEDDDYLETRIRDLKDKDIRFQRHGFNAGASVLAWVAFWDMANRHQDDWRFQMLSWACVITAIWASVNL